MMPYFRNYIPTDISCYRSSHASKNKSPRWDVSGKRAAPPPNPFWRCNDSPCIYSHVANQVMQSHGDNTSACNSPHPRIVRHTTHDAMILYLFFIAPWYWPSPSPNPVEIARPLTHPFSPCHDVVVVVATTEEEATEVSYNDDDK